MTQLTKVLIVEDEAVIALNLELQLETLGYSVVGMCARAEDAIDKVCTLAPDLVLMDIQLAGNMDGIEAASVIRSQLKIPVVFLTAFSENTTLKRATASLPYGYLVKPFDNRELHATLQVALARREVEQALADSETRLQLAIEAADLGVWEFNVDKQRLSPGDRTAGILGEPVSMSEDCGEFMRRVHPEDRIAITAALEASLMGNGRVHIIFKSNPGHYPNTRWFEVQGKLTDLPAPCGAANARMIGVIRDITEQRAIELRLREAAAVLDAAAEAIIVFDDSGHLLSANPAFTQITGFGPEEVMGRHWSFFVAQRWRDMPRAAVQSALATHGHWRGEAEFQRKSTESFSAWLSISVIETLEARRNEVWVLADISQLKKAEDRLHFLAYHDALTSLPNRQRFNEHLASYIQAGYQGRCALMLLDLDGFKNVNDTLGHAAGDVLLQIAAKRIKSCLRGVDMVARLGGDEFAIFINDLASDFDVEPIAQKVLDALVEPCDISGQRVNIAGSIGISYYPKDGLTSGELLSAADLAMYSAKAAGRGVYRIYDSVLGSNLAERLMLEADLQEALRTGQGLTMHYQPQVAVADGRIVSIEALLRWQHPRLGLLYPMSFLEIAEASGLMVPLGRWVLQSCCEFARNFIADDVRVAINCSGIELVADDFIQAVRQALIQHDIPANLIEIEITERTLYEFNKSVKSLQELRELGISIAIDDFGIGYSSFASLKHLPIDRIKIDQSFIRESSHSSNDQSILAAIIAMGHTLGLSVVAEGVETEHQSDLLKTFGCDVLQGYLYGKPCSGEELLEACCHETKSRSA